MSLYDRLPKDYKPWLAQRMKGHKFLSLKEVERQMSVESGGNPKAYNDTGASGLFQQLPGTFKDQNVGNDIWDPYQNTEAYLSYMDEGYAAEGSKAGAYGYYFAGPDHRGWGPKTRKYINDNTGMVGAYRQGIRDDPRGLEIKQAMGDDTQISPLEEAYYAQRDKPVELINKTEQENALDNPYSWQSLFEYVNGGRM